MAEHQFLQKQAEEVPKRWKSFREFKGMNTQSDRTAIEGDQFAYLENLQPIGPANLKTVPSISAALIDYGADTIYARRSVNIGSVEYLILFAITGKVFAYNVPSNTSAQINSAGTLLSGANSRCDQWKNSVVVFSDANGLYYWDGSTFAKLTGVGVPSSGSAIAVYANRVWVVQGRVLYTSAVDGYGLTAIGATQWLPLTAYVVGNKVSNGANVYTCTVSGTSAASGGPTGTGSATTDGTVTWSYTGQNDWSAAAGAIFNNLTDSTLRSTVTELFAANGYLYLFGNTSINIISDVRIPSGASPPAPIYTNLNVHAIVGTDQPPSIFVWNRTVMFATRYGVYALDGANVQRISSDIDGTWQNLDFSQGITGGSVTLNNILCAGFCVKWTDPIGGTRTVIPIFFDGKWFFGNMGTAVTMVMTAMVNSTPTMFGMIGNKLYKLFSVTSIAANGLLRTALWPMEDNLLDKKVFKVGIESTVTVLSGTFNVTIDTENSSLTLPALTPGGGVVWINNLSLVVTWINNSSNVVVWTTGGYFLLSTDATNQGKYVGVSLTSSGAVYQISGINIEYKLGARY